MVRAALSRERIVRVRLSSELEAIIFDRPGTWMADAELATLREQICRIAAAAIPGFRETPLGYGVFLDSRDPYTNRLIVLGQRVGTGEPVGFNAMPILRLTVGGLPTTVLHLGLLVIHPKYQRRGIQGMLYGLGGFS